MAYQISPGVNVSEIDLTTVVPGVATSTGAIAGVFRWGPVQERRLISSENVLLSTFGKPTTFNQETFFTAASFLGYGNSLYVVRAANTTSSDAAIGSLNAIANTATANTVATAVKNTTDYLTKTSFDAGVQYIAKYPGAIGNSLRVSVCDSANAFSSNLALYAATTASGDAISGSFDIVVGSNTGSFAFVSSGLVASATTYANTMSNTSITIGDMVSVGNTSIGTQTLKVTAVGNAVSNSTVATIAVSFSSPYRLSTNYRASNTVNGNTSVVNVQRYWEFFNTVDQGPSTSEFVAQFGNSAVVDTMHVVVEDRGGLFTGVSGNILEVYKDVSRATNAKSSAGASTYYKTVINQSSKYIWWANDRVGAASANASSVVTSTNAVPYHKSFVGGTDGYSESTATVAVLATAYDMYKSKEDVDISLVLQGRPTGGTTVVRGQTVNNFQLANYLIDNIAETRKDCVVFITPDDDAVKSYAGQETTSLVNWAGAVHTSTYAFIDSGYKYFYDRYNDEYMYVPVNGDNAGMCARAEQTNDAWWSPAGFNRGQLKNVIKLRFNPTKTDRDVLYKNAINPVVTFPGQGTVLFGDKTYTLKSSAFDRINVRRLFIVLEKAISDASKFSLFEFNDAFTRSQFVSLVNPYLRDIQARRGIVEFLVVCDSTNNTPERIDRNEFWGDIYIKPSRSINFIQLNFVAVRTGVTFDTIVGQF